jgi:hypothetical protein
VTICRPVRKVARVVNHALLKNDAYSKPIVAAVNGDCIGGGLKLLLSTDIRAAVPEARLACTKSSGRSIRSAAGYRTDTVENRGALRVW